MEEGWSVVLKYSSSNGKVHNYGIDTSAPPLFLYQSTRAIHFFLSSFDAVWSTCAGRERVCRTRESEAADLGQEYFSLKEHGD